MKENKIDIKELFTSLQSQMQGILATNSKFITHPGSEGDSLENAWIDLLRNYLPNRYSVDKAMVIDHKGNVSQQIDIVIYDNWYTPFIFNQNGFKYIPAEGVYAVFEVKPDIGGTSAGKHNIEDTVEKHIKELSGFYTLEMGCTIENGSFFVDYNNKEGETEIKTANFEDFQKYYNNREFNSIKFSNPNHSLIMFLMQLTSYLQQSIGTVPAIDMQKYLDNINETIDDEI